jgi:hypothetical protein
VAQRVVGDNHGATKRGTERVYDVNQPMPTITTVDAWGVVEPFLVEYRGSHAGRDDGNRRVKSINEPLPTQTCENCFGLMEPLIVTTKDGFGLVQFGEGSIWTSTSGCSPGANWRGPWASPSGMSLKGTAARKSE